MRPPIPNKGSKDKRNQANNEPIHLNLERTQLGYLEQHGYSKTNKEFGKIESLTFKKKTNIPLSPLKF